MPVPKTNNEFLDVVRKSGVVSTEILDAYLAKFNDENPLPEDPKQLAGQMSLEGLLTYFQVGQCLQGKWRGFTIGPFRILEKLPDGGIGSAFLCVHNDYQCRMAVKLLPSGRTRNPEMLALFELEAQTAFALTHKHVVRPFEVCLEGNVHYLAFEFVDGISFRSLVEKNGPLDIPHAIDYIRQAATAVKFAHEHELVHRDIKPDAFLVDHLGVVKLMDLGMALFFHNKDDNLTNRFDERSVLGTPDFLSPEQALNSHNVDARSDIYSLGGTLYYLLSGKTPYGEGTVAQKLLWHQIRPISDIRLSRPDVPMELAEVVMKMMAKDREKRFQTAQEVIEALLPWQEDVSPPSREWFPELSLAANQYKSSAGLPAFVNPFRKPETHVGEPSEEGSSTGSSRVDIGQAGNSESKPHGETTNGIAAHKATLPTVPPEVPRPGEATRRAVKDFIAGRQSETPTSGDPKPGNEEAIPREESSKRPARPTKIFPKLRVTGTQKALPNSTRLERAATSKPDATVKPKSNGSSAKMLKLEVPQGTPCTLQTGPRGEERTSKPIPVLPTTAKVSIWVWIAVALLSASFALGISVILWIVLLKK